MKIYISSSWKNRDKVREMTVRLRKDGHKVYDFTDPTTRKVPESPPEVFPEFNPAKDKYSEYCRNVNAYACVMNNQEALRWCDLCILLLPCGNDAHSDWGYAVGNGKHSVVVGTPRDRAYTHLWADKIIDNPDDVYAFIKSYY